MKFDIMKSRANEHTNWVWVINRVFSSYQDKQHATYKNNRKDFVNDMIMYLDL
jgi:hypothetical protein